MQSVESGITVLSTLNQMYNGYGKASESLSRHPSGTKASGLRQRLKGKNRVAKKNFRTTMDDLGEDKDTI
jgi:hypothetical protein